MFAEAQWGMGRMMWAITGWYDHKVEGLASKTLIFTLPIPVILQVKEQVPRHASSL